MKDFYIELSYINSFFSSQLFLSSKDEKITTATQSP
jgi:hypothetical protein